METTAGKLGNILKIFRILLLLLVLLAGMAAGLLMGGGIYVIADRISPWIERVPVLGSKVYPLLERMSPPVTGYERRLRELQEKEEYLLAKSKALDEEKAGLEDEKKEIREQKTQLEQKLAAIESREKEAKDPENGDDTALFGLVSESFMEMPPSKAAKIIALLPLEEAASLLKVMDPEQRSQVLGKMTPESAARLVRFSRIETKRT